MPSSSFSGRTEGVVDTGGKKPRKRFDRRTLSSSSSNARDRLFFRTTAGVDRGCSEGLLGGGGGNGEVGGSEGGRMEVSGAIGNEACDWAAP